MSLRSMKGIDFGGKKVLIRVDFNVEMNNVGEVQEHFRFDIAKKTIDQVLSFPGAKVALLTHFGRPDGQKNPEYSTARLAPAAGRAIGRKVVCVDDCIGEKVSTTLASLEEGAVLLLENVRFYAEEERNDEAFAKQLAATFDVFINDAFSVCHRAHASVAAITEFLPAYAGFRILEEVEKLDTVRLFPKRPAIAVIGGAKIETKLPLIRSLEGSYDCILVGGKIANEAIDQKIEFSDKVLLPQDFAKDRLDIGPNTVAYFTQIIKTGKTIVWNGPMGKFEEKPYDIGTGAILQAMVDNEEAFVVIGGGESLAVIEHAGAYEKIGFVSSGGGAMLEYMSGKELPGLKALEA